MIQVSRSQVTPQIRELFSPDAPASLRCFAVLDGQSIGQVWVDRFLSPNAGIVREAAFGSLYFGGALDAAMINDMISSLKDLGEVLIGLWPDDGLWERLPFNPDYVGSVLEFSHRIADESGSLLSEPLPEGCQSIAPSRQRPAQVQHDDELSHQCLWERRKGFRARDWALPEERRRDIEREFCWAFSEWTN